MGRIGEGKAKEGHWRGRGGEEMGVKEEERKEKYGKGRKGGRKGKGS